MKKDIIIDDGFSFGGFTAGNSGIWTREKADDPPSEDYVSLSRELGVSVGRIVRPYQAGGEKVAVADFEHGGCGVVREDPFIRTDGLVTNCRGLVLSIIAADCVPIYLSDERAGVIGLLHCGRQAAAGELISNSVDVMTSLGASAERIVLTIGHHICGSCYEVGMEVVNGFAETFSKKELESIFSINGEKVHLELSGAIVIKAVREGIRRENIHINGSCTCCGSSYYSYRRGDRGRQNLAFFMMKEEQ